VLGYYIQLASRSLRGSMMLSTLMVIAIAFGVGASMTTLTVLRLLSADPIPAKSQRLFYVQIDARPRDDGDAPGERLPEQVTRFDAEALVRAGRADRQAMMTAGSAPVMPEHEGIAPYFVDARYTSSELFAMFDVPFLAGAGWTADDDTRSARVAVIARSLALRQFGTVEAVGKQVRVGREVLRVIGVVADWRPSPRYYDLSSPFGPAEQLFVPFSTSRELHLRGTSPVSCWGDAPDPDAVEAPCAWIQLWVELDTDSKRAAYRDFLASWAIEQRRAGRLERPAAPTMRSVPDRLADRGVVPRDVRIQTWIAFSFLVVCLVNTVGLLLTKFLRRSVEFGVRRALGACRGAIFAQLLVEAGTIGMVGGVLGLGFTVLGLWAVRHQPTAYADLAHLDAPMLVLTFALAVAGSTLAGVFPALRASRVTPSIQLKAQ
jgi:putative ABC transport system permease protein